jgi:hexosaminidase
VTAVIPRPAHTEPAPGALDPAGPWRIRATCGELAPVAAALTDLVRPHLGDRLVDAASGGSGVREITLALGRTAPAVPALGVSPRGEAVPADESYELAVTEDGISCRAGTAEGAFRAGTTALQLLATVDGDLPCHATADAPHFAWRGLMLDPARAFLTVDEVKRLIDLAALYKINTVHLHLTDDQGWRLAIRGLPALTADGPHYTADEYRDLQDYAAARFITVVPEIDLPGHCAALRSAFPELALLPADPSVDALRERATRLLGFNPFTAPLDLADPDTGHIVAAILTEVCALTDGPFVHIGADEAFGMSHADYNHAVRELRAIVRAAGKHPIGWQETSRAGVTPGDIAQYWIDPDIADPVADHLPPEFAELVGAVKSQFAETANDIPRVLEGRGRVLLSPQSHLYLDRPYDPAVVPVEQAAEVGRLGLPVYRAQTLEDHASWDPASHGLPDEHIAGVETALWGETITGFDDACMLLLPRLPATADTAWHGTPAPWADHRDRLVRQARIWRDRRLPFLAGREVPWPDV